MRLGREFRRGLEQGRHDGEVTLVQRQIEVRFGGVPDFLRDRMANMSDAELETVAVRPLDARKIEDLLP